MEDNMHIYQRIEQIAKKHDGKRPFIFVEIGAYRLEDSKNITNIFVNFGVQYRYFAFEPEKSNIKYIHDNKLDVDQAISLWEYAVSDENGCAEFYVSSGNINPASESWSGSSSLNKPKEHLKAFEWCKFEEKQTVQTITLDTFKDVTGLDHIDFIWCDTQGNEHKVIQGAQDILKKTKYFYGEHYEAEMYEGQVPLDQWSKLLPGNWELVEKYPNDALFMNKDFNAQTT